MTLDAELEKKVLAALTKNEHGVYLALSPDIVQQIVQQVGELRKKFEELSQTPILLTSQIIRVYLSRMLATFYPDIYVSPLMKSRAMCRYRPLATLHFSRRKSVHRDGEGYLHE